MEVGKKLHQLPLDFSVNVKTEKPANISISVSSSDNMPTTVLLSPDKVSTSAFKVVTPKNADGKFHITKRKIRDAK